MNIANATLHINALRVSTKIGVYAWEQQILQPLLIDLQIPINISHCDDKIENTLDYATICQEITTLVESNSFALIETVANNIATHIKKLYSITNKITVSVSKPNAIKNADMVKITVIN